MDNINQLAIIPSEGYAHNAWLNDSGLGPNDLGAAPIPVPEDGSGERFSLAYSNAFMVMTDDPKKQEGLAKFMAMSRIYRCKITLQIQTFKLLKASNNQLRDVTWSNNFVNNSWQQV